MALIILAILTGLVAATVALICGAGLLIAFGAYTLGGILGLSLSVAWLCLPRASISLKRTVISRL